MGYTVQTLSRGTSYHKDYPAATRIDVKQNHLFIYDSADNILAIYQSGWWIRCVKSETLKISVTDKNS